MPYTSGRRTWLPRAINSPASSGLETFCELTEWMHRRPPLGLSQGPRPSPFSSQLEPALPAGRWQGRSAEAAAFTWDAQPARSRSGAALRANFGPRQSAGGRRRDSKQGAGPEPVPVGVTRPEQRCGGPASQGPPPRLSWARSVVRSPARLPRHSAPLSRPGWAGLHHRDITSIPGAPPGPAALQVQAILIPSNKARPALPPPTHLQARPKRTFGLGREIGVSGQTDRWVVAVYCHAPARGRARTCAYSLSGLAFLSRKRFGVQSSTPLGYISQRSHAPRDARWPPWRVSP